MQERQLLADVLKRRKRRGSDGPSRLDLVDRSAHEAPLGQHDVINRPIKRPTGKHTTAVMIMITAGRNLLSSQALGVGCRDKTTEMHSDLDENFILITSYFYYIFTQISILSITFY